LALATLLKIDLRDVAVAIGDVNDSDGTILNRGLVLVGIAYAC
jgi:hypothetical protein